MSSPMIAWVPAVNRIYKYLTTPTSRASQIIDIPSVEIHDVETAAEKRPRTLKHLLKANHINFAVFYSRLRFHNHMPHILSSAYILGAGPDELQHIYSEEAKELEPWQDSPGEISENDWRDFLGDKTYQRAFVDFFEDELALKYNYNWRSVAEEYLYSGKNPLINCVVSGLGHPLIHLGYAYEMSNREIGIEALSLIAGGYNHYHKYLDDESYTKPSPNPSTSPLELLQRLAKDDRFAGVVMAEKEDIYEAVPEDFESVLLEYWNAWTIADPKKQFQESQEAAVALFISSVPADTKKYDFFLVHLLTTSHAVRILLPIVPGKYHISLVRQWWLLTLTAYIGQMRPKIDEGMIDRIDLKGRDWKFVEYKAINGPHAIDAHYVKGVRAMKEAASTWGDPKEWYLKAAVKFADEFDGWSF